MGGLQERQARKIVCIYLICEGKIRTVPVYGTSVSSALNRSERILQEDRKARKRVEKVLNDN
jgi:hypothetical protein